jgi:hypothetical protein
MNKRIWDRAMILAAAIGFTVVMTAKATVYTVNLVAGTYECTNSTTFTPNGVPGPQDDIVYGVLPWASSMTLNMSDTQQVNQIVFTNAIQGNNHSFNFGLSNRVNIIKSFRQNKGGNDHLIVTPNSKTLTLTEFHDLGLYRGNLSSGNVNSYWDLQGDVKITYHSDLVVSYGNAFGGGQIFTNATSVYLARNIASISNKCEWIYNPVSGNLNQPAYNIGRSDNQLQSWTVAPGSHPILICNPSQQSVGIQKTGTGPVSMPDVDLFISANLDCGISSNGLGNHGGFTRGGIITANSLTIDASPSSAKRSIGIIEHIALDGQAGLNSGGTGNGHAFSLVTSNQVLSARVNNLGATSLIDVGRIAIEPEGGDVYLDSFGTGLVDLNICNNNRDEHVHTNSVALTANTLNLATTNCSLSDRCTWDNADSSSGGILEFRGHFISRSTRTNDFRLDFTTVRAIDGWTNDLQRFECMSRDLGAADPGTNNFVLGKLVLGQAATGTTSKVTLHLRDQFDNNVSDAQPEVVYAKNLALYAGSILYLNGCKLYHKNSGTWQLATAGTFATGDGTGIIRNSPKPTGAVLMVK